MSSSEGQTNLIQADLCSLNQTNDSRLCWQCKTLVSILGGNCEHNLGKGRHCHHGFHLGVQAFSDSARAGCLLCILLWSQVYRELDYVFCVRAMEPQDIFFAYGIDERRTDSHGLPGIYSFRFYAPDEKGEYIFPEIRVHGVAVDSERSYISQL